VARHIDELLRGAVAAHQIGDRTQAERLYRLVLATEKRNPDALHFLGLLRAESGELDDAAQFLGKAARANPKSADIHANLGRVLSLLNRHRDALQSYEKALGVDADHPAALINCAGAMLNLNLSNKALLLLDRLIGRQPKLPIALHNRCVALLDLHCYESVIADADTLLSLDPKDADAWYKKGMALSALRRHDEAFKAFDAAYTGRPSLPCLEGRRLHAKLFICDWSDIGQEIARLRRHVQEGQNATSPFALLSVSSSLAEQLRCAQTYVRNTYPPGVVKALPGAARRKGKIHLGYVSGDFREHATAFLTADLFECHDRQRFKLFAVSTGADDGSAIRSRISAAFDEFFDARNLPGPSIAEWIRERDIDVLVNLNGFCGDERTDIFLSRPAPVQVNFLGYPGTMGAAYIDYIVVDPALVAEEEQAHFSEKCVWLPDCYQPNDRQRPISDRTYSRRDMGLPDEGFVYCCFNNSFKLTPEAFDTWMRVLNAVDGSVLWLLECGVAEGNLRREAKRRGVAAERIVFAKRLPLAEHLSRLRLADLFLDTLPYNAHTTASDALWVGVPVLACRGATFASRVADSLLRAVDLPDLVTTSLPDYEAAAVSLARTPAALADLRQRLWRSRATCPLFDTPRYARHIEAAYAEMWRRHTRGEAPAAIRVAPL
jgi:predicted O-linked N-acetylglucosamine transferase (SPINDLY family)